MLFDEKTLTFDEVAEAAGFERDGSGRWNLEPSDKTAMLLQDAARLLVGVWRPGMLPLVLTLTGAGPIWGYLAIAEGLRSRIICLKYAAPNATILVWSRGY